jgi:hypothetical protein
MKEWQKHIGKLPERENGTVPTLCGTREMGWAFVDVGHWLLNRLDEGRLMACPDCLAIVRSAVDAEAPTKESGT